MSKPGESGAARGPAGNPAEYTRVRVRGRAGAVGIQALEACIGHRSNRAAVVHVRGRCRDGAAFAGCLVIVEGRDEPEFDLRVYGGPHDTDALAEAIEACLAEGSTIVHEEMTRIGGKGGRPAKRRRRR